MIEQQVEQQQASEQAQPWAVRWAKYPGEALAPASLPARAVYAVIDEQAGQRGWWYPRGGRAEIGRLAARPVVAADGSRVMVPLSVSTVTRALRE